MTIDTKEFRDLLAWVIKDVGEPQASFHRERFIAHIDAQLAAARAAALEEAAETVVGYGDASYRIRALADDVKMSELSPEIADLLSQNNGLGVTSSVKPAAPTQAAPTCGNSLQSPFEPQPKVELGLGKLVLETAQAPSVSEHDERTRIEAAAKAIYHLFPFAGLHPWVEGGNSIKQDEARQYARAALNQGAQAAQGGGVQAAPTAWLATDLDGRGDVGFTKEEAKRRAGEGCTHFYPLYEPCDLSAHPAPSAAAGQTIYQVKMPGSAPGVWNDATEDAYHTFTPEHRRIVYEGTAPAQVAQGEPVHQMRDKRSGGGWVECDADEATCIKRMPHWADRYEFRTLYAAPVAPSQAQQAGRQSDLTTSVCPACSGTRQQFGGFACDECSGQGKIIVSKRDLATHQASAQEDHGTLSDEIARLHAKLDRTPLTYSSERMDLAVEIDRLKAKQASTKAGEGRDQ